MEAIKKQAIKLREQVAKQQQAVLKHLGHLSNEAIVVDEVELECHKQLQNLYNSTRAAKHFQRNLVRGIEGFISVSLKQTEIVKKLAEDCCKYGTENQTTDPRVARAALHFGTCHDLMENEREILLRVLGDQVSEPLRALVTAAPLEDARHLTRRYERLRHEVEAQAAEVLRRRSKIRESDISAESAMKLRNAEARLTELKSNVKALGREATAAMLSVENQQQQITYQRLCTMVDAERTYHQRVIATLEKLYAEMIQEEESDESSLQSVTTEADTNALPANENITSAPPANQNITSAPPAHQNITNAPPARQNITNAPPAPVNIESGESDLQKHVSQNDEYFIAKVIHPFDAQADGELSLSVDDYVVVRQVAPTGWSEGECQGKAGWFPSAYVEREEKAPVSKMLEANSTL